MGMSIVPGDIAGSSHSKAHVGAASVAYRMGLRTAHCYWLHIGLHLSLKLCLLMCENGLARRLSREKHWMCQSDCVSLVFGADMKNP